MDKRKQNGAKPGEKRGQGRKSKVDELKLIDRLEAVMTSDEVLKRLVKHIKEGDIRAIFKYLEYRFGKPRETIEMKTEVTEVRQVFKIGDQIIEL
jgi:hypothetical protein